MIRSSKLFNAAACGIALLAFGVFASPARGDVTEIQQFSAYGGRSLGLGDGVHATGMLGAGAGGFSADQEVQVNSVYTTGTAWFNRNGMVTGNVVANSTGTSGTDRGLTMTGDFTTGGHTWIDRNASIEGNITADRSIGFARDANVTGNLNANGDINLDRGGTFNGNVQPGLGEHLWYHASTTITGLTSPAAADVALWQPGAFPASPGGSYGSQKVSFSRNSVETLDPGSYKDLSVGRSSAITLTAGTYDFKGVWIDHETVMTLDTSGGDITLNVHNGMSTSRNVTFQRTDADHDIYINIIDKHMWLGRENQIDAHVTVYDGDFGTGRGSVLNGSYYASRDLWLDEGSTLQGQGITLRAAAVPEPTTIVLLLVGGLALYLGQRRRSA